MPSLALASGLRARPAALQVRASSSQRRSARLLPQVRCAAGGECQEEKTLVEKLALPAAGLVAAALFMAATPDEALAARSGGRVGGSSGFSSRRAAPRAAPSSGGTTINYYSAPPIVGGWGGWGFGMPMFGGYGYGFGMPLFFGGGAIFNIMIFFIIVNVIWSVVRNFTNNSSGKKNSVDDEEW